MPNGAINENVPNPTNHYFLSGRVFHDYREGKQLWIGYSYEHRAVQNQGVGGTVLPEAGTDTYFLEHEINIGYNVTISPRLFNQLHFLVGHNDSRVQSINPNALLVVSGAFTGGGAQADMFRTESHFDGTDIVTYSTEKHEIKFGIDVPDMSRRGFDDFTNRVGTYSFANLSAYLSAQPFTYLGQSGQGHVDFLERTVAGIFEDNMRLKSNLSVAVGVRYYWQNYFHDIAHNFAPRISFAYAPTPKGKTVIRGGGGFFFDRTGPSPISDLLHFNGVLLKRFIVDSPSYPITPAQLAGVPTSVVVLDPRQRIPYTVQYGIGVEQQLNATSSVFANYLGARGIDLFRSVNVNAPAPPTYAARPNPNLGQERQIQSEGYLKSNSLEIGFRGKPVSFFTGQARYNLGKTYNNTSGITYFPANSYLPKADWARSDNDQRHHFDLLGAFETKWFTFGTALSAYSGKPVNVTTGNDDYNDGMSNARPAGVPRNSLHGPGYLDLDLNLSRDVVLTKRGGKGPVATVSLNSFDVLNHPNDVTYIGVVGSPFFGQAVAAQPPRPHTTGSANEVLTADIERRFAMRFHEKIVRYWIGASILPFALLACHASSKGQEPSGGQLLKEVADIPMPGPAVRFDYQSLDADHGRLYIAHMNADQLLVFDTQKRQVVGNLDGFKRVHGVIAVPEIGRVYASVTGEHQVAAVDMTSLKTIATSGPVTYPDGLAYSPATKRIFVSDEHGGVDAVVDTESNKLLMSVPLGGGAGNTVYDPGSGHILVAVHGVNELVAIDPAAMKIIGRYSLPGIKNPHSIALDVVSRCAFIAGEENHSLAVFDLKAMKLLSVYQVGDDPDVLAFDSGLKRLYVSAESGTVSVFQEGNQNLTPLGQFNMPHAHTVAVDPKTHLVYFPLENVNGHPLLRIMRPSDLP